MQNVQVIPAIVGATATATSTKIFIGDFTRVALLYRRANHSAGSTAFTVKAGFGTDVDANPTMTAYNMLIDNVTNTNAQMPTRINSKSLASDIDAMVWMDPAAPATHIEITATETTDGTHSAWVIGFCD
jgi:hypothetical protein